jgi:LPS export ABC transporter protein LptC
MMKETQQSRFFLFSIAIGSLLLVIFSCQSKVSTDLPPGLIEKKVLPVAEVVNFETTYNDSGVIRYHLTAPRLLNFQQQRNPAKEAYYEFPEGFHLQKYDQSGKTESEMSGNYGKVLWDQKLWYASGNVIMINNKGDTLRTEELNFDEKKDLIYTDKFVSIKKGDQYFTGSGGFRSDAQMTKWTFMKAQGHVYLEDE